MDGLRCFNNINTAYMVGQRSALSMESISAASGSKYLAATRGVFSRFNNVNTVSLNICQQTVSKLSCCDWQPYDMSHVLGADSLTFAAKLWNMEKCIGPLWTRYSDTRIFFLFKVPSIEYVRTQGRTQMHTFMSIQGGADADNLSAHGG